MPMLKPKYRGTTTYFRVLSELIQAAQYSGLTKYQDIAVLMDLPLRGAHMGRETGYLLGEISEDEVENGRPMLSAVAVGVEGRPGPGFFGFARDLGKLAPGGDEVAFWKNEKEAVYQAWKRRLPKSAV